VSAVNAGRTLREIAAEVGISAERVRQIARLGRPPDSVVDTSSIPELKNSVAQ